MKDKKTSNKIQVLNIIRNSDGINKSTIASLADISIPTSMKITDELVSQKLVRFCGIKESTGGKPSDLYEFAGDNFYSIGIDISPTKIKVVLVNLDGTILYKNTKITNGTLDVDYFIDESSELVNELLSSYNIYYTRLIGIGVGIPGILDIEKGIVIFSPNFGWENIDFSLLLGDKLSSLTNKKFRIVIENTNRALAISENYFGMAKKSDNFICVNLGYGIGSAIMNQGVLYTGASGTAGEIGHITVEKDGQLCTCGNNGCLEALASGRAIALQARALILSGVDTKILEFSGGDIKNVKAKTVFEAADNGDEAALDIALKAGNYIGIGLATFINLYDPERIILAGGLSKSPIITDKIKEVAKKRQMKYAGRQVKIRISDLGEYSTAMGAGSVYLMQLMQQGITNI